MCIFKSNAAALVPRLHQVLPTIFEYNVMCHFSAPRVLRLFPTIAAFLVWCRKIPVPINGHLQKKRKQKQKKKEKKQ